MIQEAPSSSSPSSNSQSVWKYDVLVLGGGFGGVYAGKALSALARKGKKSVAIIAAENHMVFQPMLPEVAGSSLSPRDVVNAIRQLCRGCYVYKGEVRSIDVKSKRVTMSAGDFTPTFTFECEHLVLAMGAVVDLSRIPGMAEHAFLMQNVGDAMKLRATIIARIEEANVDPDPERRRSILQFVVVGGGYSGVETAGQILDLLDDVHHLYRNIGKEDYSVTLVHSRDHLLPTLKRSLGEYTAQKLEKRGLRILLNRRVRSVTARQVRLDDETKLPTSLVVCTVGNAPHPLVLELGEKQGVPLERGRIVTNDRCQVEGFDGLWSAGDCAAVPLHSGGVCPPTAQFAMREAKVLGENICATYAGRDLKPFTFTGLGEFAAIGHRNAVGEAMGIKVSGFLAWWMWRTIYLSKLPGMERKLRVLIEWSLEVFFSRDINLLTPRYTRSLNEMYLEPGDSLFHAGDPAFSFYIVKAGRVEIRDRNGSVIRTVNQGEYFGERAMLTDKTWRFDAVAAEASELVAIGAETFEKITQASTSFQQLLQSTAATWQSKEELDHLKERIPGPRRHAPVSTAMKEEPVTLSPGMSADEAMERIQRESHGAYPLIGEDGTVVGMLRRSQLYEWFKNLQPGRTHTIASAPVTTVPMVTQETRVDAVLEQMVRSGTTRSLVIDGERKLLGVVTLTDILLSRDQ